MLQSNCCYVYLMLSVLDFILNKRWRHWVWLFARLSKLIFFFFFFFVVVVTCSRHIIDVFRTFQLRGLGYWTSVSTITFCFIPFLSTFILSLLDNSFRGFFFNGKNRLGLRLGIEKSTRILILTWSVIRLKLKFKIYVIYIYMCVIIAKIY